MLNRVKTALLSCCFATFGIATTETLALSLTQDVEAATKALEGGDHATAIKAYEALISEEGLVNGHLFYNLGIAYFRSGETGDAVSAFLAARRFLPRDPDVAANLRFALTKIADKLDADKPREARNSISSVLDKVTARELALTLGILVGLIGLALALSLTVRAVGPFRNGVLGSLIFPLLIAGLLTAKLQQPEIWGAVNTTANAAVYSGPSEQNTKVFELHDGAPVLITERGTSGYLRILLSDGKSGWITGSQVKVVGPQFGAL